MAGPRAAGGASSLDATVRKARAEAVNEAADKLSGMRRLITTHSQEAWAPYLVLLRGAGDENRTRALSLGSCGHLGLVLALTWADGRGVVPSSLAAFPVIPRCSPLLLVRLWCGAEL